MKKRTTPKKGPSPAIQPGYRKGMKPANAGRIFPPQAFNDEDFMALYYGCSRTSAVGLRDRALMTVMYRSGLRISEALALHPSDLRRDEHAILVRCGKGGKQRMAFMDDFGWETLGIWLARREKVTDPTQGWVFCTVSQPNPGGRLGSPQVRMMMKRKGLQSGLKRRCNPHALRHGFAVGLLKSGATIAEICDLMGHSNMATTHVYLNHVDPTSKVAAVNARPRPGGSVAPNPSSWQEQAKAAGWQQIEIPAEDVESEAA